MHRSGILFVISAPSGAGKTSISRELFARHADLRPSISYTTRSMRPGEQEGVDYHFIAPDQFQRMIDQGAFAEWAVVHGNRYGTAKANLLQSTSQGCDVLLDIDVQGAAQLRAAKLPAVFIFILPPTMAVLRQRLAGRKTDSDEIIERRMQNAVKEIHEAVHFDYLVVNDDLARAVANVEAIMVAEKNRRERVVAGMPAEFGL